MKELKKYTMDNTSLDEMCNTVFYKKSEADRYIAWLKYKRCERMAYWCACRSTAFVDENWAKSEWYDKWKFAWRKLAEHYKELAK